MVRQLLNTLTVPLDWVTALNVYSKVQRQKLQRGLTHARHFLLTASKICTRMNSSNGRSLRPRYVAGECFELSPTHRSSMGEDAKPAALLHCSHLSRNIVPFPQYPAVKWFYVGLSADVLACRIQEPKHAAPSCSW
jgi:hypothetical protein